MKGRSLALSKTQTPASQIQLMYLPFGLHLSIFAVHGLGASPEWAWIRKVKDGSRNVHVNWLKDPEMLPSKLPNSRIMTFNYESKWLLAAPKQRRSLCAIQLLTALDNRRNEVTLVPATVTPISLSNNRKKILDIDH